MKVLLIGMQYMPNQYSRAIESYEGFECIHISGDPGGHLPQADAAVFALSHQSHGKYWQAKDHCKENDIPMFFAYQGFSDIKVDFEKWIIDENEAVIRKGVSNGTSLAAAMKQAAIDQKQKEAEKPKEKVVALNCTDEGYKAAVREICEQSFEADIHPKKIVELLVSRGYPTNSKGKPWDANQIYMRRAGWRQKNSGQSASKPSLKTGGRAPARANSQLDLIAKVLNSGQSMPRKLELIEEIQAGLLLTENQVRAIRDGEYLKLQRRNILADTDQELITLDKVTAAAVVDSLSLIEDFLTGA